MQMSFEYELCAEHIHKHEQRRGTYLECAGWGLRGGGAGRISGGNFFN